MRINFLWLSHKGKKTHQHTKHKKQEGERKRGEEKENLFENRFRSGGEENERIMENKVMQEMRFYDGYLVCLYLA